MKKIVIDLDGTLTKNDSSDYGTVSPNFDVINELLRYKSIGYSIIIQTARNMRTFKGNVGKINIHTLPKIIEWLDKHSVPYDEIHVGKPWCGHEGFYVDDRAIRPSEFVNLETYEIEELLKKERKLCS